MASVLILPWDDTALKLHMAIEKGMIQKGITKQQLAGKSRIPYSTLCRKLHNPNYFTLAEMTSILSVLGKEIDVTNINIETARCMK